MHDEFQAHPARLALEQGDDLSQTDIAVVRY